MGLMGPVGLRDGGAPKPWPGGLWAQGLWVGAVGAWKELEGTGGAAEGVGMRGIITAAAAAACGGGKTHGKHTCRRRRVSIEVTGLASAGC
jgi:hypothetical protein